MAKRTFESDFERLVKDMIDDEGVQVGDGVLPQLVHFSHSFIGQLFQSAQDLVAMTDTIRPEHVQLANAVTNRNSQMLDTKELVSLASELNSIPLVSVADRPGLKLPQEEDCLLGPNYQICEDTGTDSYIQIPTSSQEITEEDLVQATESSEQFDIPLPTNGQEPATLPDTENNASIRRDDPTGSQQFDSLVDALGNGDVENGDDEMSGGGDDDNSVDNALDVMLQPDSLEMGLESQTMENELGGGQGGGLSMSMRMDDMGEDEEDEEEEEEDGDDDES